MEINTSNGQNAFFGENMSNPDDGGNMTKEDRQRVVLDFMGEYDIALRPAELYRNLRFHRRITFSKESVDNYLEEFVKEGLVHRVKPQALEMGNIVEAPEDQRAYYIISDAGREYLKSSDA